MLKFTFSAPGVGCSEERKVHQRPAIRRRSSAKQMNVKTKCCGLVVDCAACTPWTGPKRHNGPVSCCDNDIRRLSAFLAAFLFVYIQRRVFGGRRRPPARHTHRRRVCRTRSSTSAVINFGENQKISIALFLTRWNHRRRAWSC